MVKAPESGESMWSWLRRHRKLAGGVAFFAALAMMLLQLFKPFPEAVNRVLIAACQLTFYGAALVAVYFMFFYRQAPSSEAVAARDTPSGDEFWAEARRRHRLHFLVWVGWLAVWLPLWKLYCLMLPRQDPMVAMVLALVTWMGVIQWAGWRVTSMICFNCGHRAFDRIPTFMRRAKCSHCGTPYKADQRS